MARDILLIFLVYICCDTIQANFKFYLVNETDYMYDKGSSKVFHCVVNTTLKISRVDWFRDDVLMVSYKRNPQERFFGNGQIMQVDEFRSSDSGLYKCKVFFFNHDNVLEREFKVPPTKVPDIIKSQNIFMEATVGDDIKFKCLVSKYYTRMYEWYKNGGLRLKSDFRNVKIKQYKFYRIKRLTINDTGFYTCRVSNDIGVSELTYTLKVLEKTNSTLARKPTLKNKENTYVEIVLNDITLDCSVEGARPINVTWLKEGKPLGWRTNGYEFQENDQKLKLKELLPTDRGHYTCIVQNRYGRVIHTLELDPQERSEKQPSFFGKNEKKIVIEAILGTNVTVVVSMMSFGTAHFQLLYHNIVYVGKNKTQKTELIVMNTPSRYFIIDDTVASTHAEKRQLEYYFTNISEKDYGIYSIMAGNVIGFDIYQFTLKRKYPAVTQSSTGKTHGNKNWSSSIIFISLATAVGILLVALPIALVIWCRRSKKHLNNNNKLFTPTPKVALNLSDGNGKFTVIDGKTTRKMHFSRLSSCQTEKDYLYQYHPLPPDPEWEIPLKNITFKGLLGEGAFGQVMLATMQSEHDPCSVTVAVKMLKDGATEQELKDLITEIQVMKTIGKHDNIVNLIGVSSQEDDLCMIIEFCPYGNLRSYLKQRRPTLPPKPPPIEFLTLKHLTSFCLQVAKGMEYLASHKCIHRDIAARNILVSEDHVVKVADFGLARDVHVADYYRKCTDGRLPVKWMAMEALFDRVYTTKSDIWSFGILIWEVITFGGSPYPGIPLERLFDLLKQGYRMDKPVNCTDEMYAIMLNCWKEISSKRPTFSELKEDLQQMLVNLNEKEYLVLQPPIVSPFPTESISSLPADLFIDSRHSSSSVFEDKLEAEDDELRVDLKKSESVVLLPNENGFKNDIVNTTKL